MAVRPIYNKTLKFLYDLQLFGIKVGLNNIQTLLRYLGNPENHFPTIHIAGTNGKGSTASMIASILTASGYRTGLYTSPHLIDFSERIRIDGERIAADRIVHYTKILKPEIERTKATFFEVTTAIAFQYFSDERVGIAVIETGLGGRWDATNVISPLISVITNIDIEHTEYLGKTYKKIASEKGGIIKPFIPCVTATKNSEALNQLKLISRKNDSRLIEIDMISSCLLRRETLIGSVVDVRINNVEYKNIFLSLAGEHQIQNLLLSIFTVEYIKKVEGFKQISEKSIRTGLSLISRYSGLRGRIDLIQHSPLVIADVAHNPHGISTLVLALKRLIVGKVVTVFGVMIDKDYRSMITILKPISRCMVSVAPQTSRARGDGDLIDEFHAQSINSFKGGSVEIGLQRAFEECRHNETVLITGSHYVVGEALKSLKFYK
ncbi:MAG: bifunctional folylpolyglutamate synthase/dihydrofolate synthase [Ignavibacteriales bacterium]|nr:bifunctional folylpolyglutamate synthase/dihydrofolate synthase [Ignavibacteriales bacterium]